MHGNNRIGVTVAFVICSHIFGNAMLITHENVMKPFAIGAIEEQPMNLAYEDNSESMNAEENAFRRNCFFSPVQCMFRRSTT
uniref:Secreted protein n=1 Tax=Ascaris lumbricoides TaxID=6252 RepID=A0A0M3IFG7_ASCLU